MKNVFLFALLIVGMTTNAQFIKISKESREYFTASIYNDPVGSINEKGLDIGADIEYVGYWGYVKAGVQYFPALQGRYLDTVGGAGFNFTTKPFECFRLYTGIRLGLVHRGLGTGDGITYPLAGLEAGIDYNITDKWFVGLATTADWREDFKFSGAEPKMQHSGRVRAGFKFW